MKKFVALLVLSLSVNCVIAENLFQSNNPFPQTVPQTMNNIYESKPVVMEREQQKEQSRLKSWFKRKRDNAKTESSNYVIPESRVINEGEISPETTVRETSKGISGTKDGSFYVFK